MVSSSDKRLYEFWGHVPPSAPSPPPPPPPIEVAGEPWEDPVEAIRALGIDTDKLHSSRDRLIELKKIVEERESCSAHLEPYVRSCWDTYSPGRLLIWNWHLSHICEHLEAVHVKQIKYLVITVPPRGLKSTLTSVMYPSWSWTDDPSRQFLTLSHSEDDVAIRDAVYTRRILTSPWYRRRWGDKFTLTSDQNEKSSYQNDKRGHRLAKSITSRLTGVGGDEIIIDDPHSVEQAVSEVELKRTIRAFDETVSTRLNDWNTGAIILIMQRLAPGDLAGHVLEKFGSDVVHIRLPMEFDRRAYVGWCGMTDPRKEAGELLFPVRYNAKTVERMKQQLGPYAAAAQLQQDPTPQQGTIIQRDQWKKWTEPELPVMEWKLLALDGAWSGKDLGRGTKYDPRRSQSAITVWGAFSVRGTKQKAIILLESWADWKEYPETEKKTLEMVKRNKPETILVENAASGIPILVALRRVGLFPNAYRPDRDKERRMKAASSVFEGGAVYYVDNWENQVTIAQVTAFPADRLNDRADTVSMAANYFRHLGLVNTPAEIADDEEYDPMDRFFQERGSSYVGVFN